MTARLGSYVVLKRISGTDWKMLGEVPRRPGLPARSSRAQALRAVPGREPEDSETYVVLPSSEWRLGLDH